MRIDHQLIKPDIERPVLKNNNDFIPYNHIQPVLSRSAISFALEALAGVDYLLDSDEDSDQLTTIRNTMAHLNNVMTAVARLQDKFSNCLEDFEAFRTESDVLVAAFRKALTRYPVSATVDAAVSVEISDFTSHLTSATDHDVAEEFTRTLSYFKSSESRSKGRPAQRW